MKMRGVGPWLLLSLGWAGVPGGSGAQQANDNPSVTAQLNDAKVIVARIKKDASDMESYSRENGLSWQTHAQKLETIKADVNKLQDNMRGLQSHRTVASAWQQEAIDRITGLGNDLATNMNDTIDHLSKNKARPTADPYPAYLKANRQIASDLADEINGTIDYGETRARKRALETQFPQ